MNWSTRLRRWVRIRMPPVREASMKPTAATVLPAPVACSNQKRRSAPGSSGASSIVVLVVLGRRLLPVLGLLVRAASVVVLELGVDRRPLRRPRSAPGCGPRRRLDRLAPRRCRRRSPSIASARLGDQRGQRARERVDLVRG